MSMEAYIEPSPRLLEFWGSLPEDARKEWESIYYNGNQAERKIINRLFNAPREELESLHEKLERLHETAKI